MLDHPRIFLVSQSLPTLVLDDGTEEEEETPPRDARAACSPAILRSRSAADLCSTPALALRDPVEMPAQSGLVDALGAWIRRFFS